ncbi:MAG: hypothetical protein CMG02_02525 [Candidatus Marinimicrobia bacterium]|nr:hypothetical protein [Candidatus Neomarinimicrobiota bacterium]RPG06031.1 MAG: hypothetical protein CBE07_000375 [Pelagibacteraceae bacterium TMED247]
MKKHKICIIGDGLSGLITAYLLGKLNLKVDLISGKKKNNNIDVRTTAISPSNLNFLKKQNLNIKDHQIYNCNEINLFFEKSKNNFTKFINYENNKKDIIHIIENEKLKKILNNKIKKNKNIKTVLKDVVDIDYGKTTILTKKMSYQYDLIVLCVGKNSILIDNYLGKRKINKNKNDLAYTCIIKHDLDISSASQYFLREGPLAILPINKKSFSLVWSLNNKFKNKSDKEIKILISKRLNRIFLKKNAFKIEYLNNYPIDFKFNKNFYKKNIVAIGESIYSVYPLAGQGFNLVIRDINELYKRINENLSLGLDLKDSAILENFSLSRKSENLLYGLGINFTQEFFRYNKYTQEIKNTLLPKLNKLEMFKKISLKISDKGILS